MFDLFFSLPYKNNAPRKRGAGRKVLQAASGEGLYCPTPSVEVQPRPHVAPTVGPASKTVTQALTHPRQPGRMVALPSSESTPGTLSTAGLTTGKRGGFYLKSE